MPASERRDQILDTTLDLVVGGGHFTVTMEAIATAMGVTKPVVYDHFANRDEVLAALLERELTVAAGSLGAVLRAPLPEGPADPDALLRERLSGWLQLVSENPTRWRFILLPPEGVPAESRAAVREGRERTRLVLEGLLRWWIERRGAKMPSDVDLEIASHLVQSTTTRAAELVLEDPGRYTPERAAAVVIGVLEPVLG